MAITDQKPRKTYAVGATAQTAFTVPFPFFSPSDLRVYVGGTLKALGADYTVTGGNGSTGTVTLTAGVSNTTVALVRRIPIDRLTDFPAAGAFKVPQLNRELDRNTAIAQQLDDDNARAIRPPDDEEDVGALPPLSERAGQVMGFDVNGKLVAANTSVEALDALTLQALQAGLVSAVIEPFASDGAQTTITTPVPLLAQAQVTLLVGGILQPPNSGAYSVTKTADGGVITLSEPAPEGVTVGGFIGFAKEVTGEVPLTNVIGLSDQLAGKLATNGDGSAVTVKGRTLDARAGDLINVLDHGTVGAGDDTAAFTAAISAAISAGKRGISIPPGVYDVDEVALPTSAFAVVGFDRNAVTLRPRANSQAIFSIADGGTYYPKMITGVGFDGNSKTGVAAIRASRVSDFTVKDCSFKSVQYNIDIDRGKGVSVSNITVRTSGKFRFYSSSDTDYLFGLHLENIAENAQDIGQNLAAQSVTEWFELTRCVNVVATNIQAQSLNGSGKGILIKGGEGFQFTNVVIAYPTTGIDTTADSIGAYPEYLWLTNVSIDQQTVSGFLLNADYVWVSGCMVVNGTLRNNSGPAIQVGAVSDSVKIAHTKVFNNYTGGLIVKSGATHVSLIDSDFYDNNDSGGSNYDLKCEADTLHDPVIDKCRIDTNSMTKQLIRNGSTSRTTYSITGQYSTTASTSEQVLASCTLPAGAVGDGESFRVRLYGSTGATANTKTLRVYFAGASVGGWSGTYNASDWWVDIEVYRTGSTSELVRRSLIQGQVALVDYASTAINLGNSLTIEVRGQPGTAVADEIVLEGFNVQLSD